MKLNRSTEEKLVVLTWGVVLGVSAVHWHVLIPTLVILLVSMVVLRVRKDDES